MGEVHAAVHEREGRPNGDPVALKLITSFSEGGGMQKERFEREAEALLALSHPSIVSVIGHGIEAQTATPYLVMELLQGEDLGACIEREGPLSEDRVLGIGVDLASALTHAHERRIIHRDIKPPNIILPKDPRARARAVLCDFGLAKRIDTITSLTATGALVGTPHYMSPEQFLDAKRVDERSDVFSLAITLLHALVGRNPLAECRTTTALMLALCTRPIPRIEDLVLECRSPVHVSRQLSEALRRALATDPQDRASLAELRRDLFECESGAMSLGSPRTLPLGSREAISSEHGRGWDGSRTNERPRPDAVEGARGLDPAATLESRAPVSGGSPPSADPRTRRSTAPRAAAAGRLEKASPPVVPAARLRSAPLRLGHGSYCVTRELEREVFEGADDDARAVRLERLPGVFSTEEGASALRAELSALGMVLTESVVALLDHGREGDDAWLVTEPLAGLSLRAEVTEEGPIPYVRAVKAFARLASGLVSLHDAGLVHGHLAPESLHFRASGQERLLVLHDLGIQKRIEATLKVASRRGHSTTNKKDPRTDVVQVVSALYFAALGKVPFGARVAHVEPKNPAHATFAAPDPNGRSALDDLVRRTLEGRIATLGALADEL